MVEARGHEPDYNFEKHWQAIDDALKCTPFTKMAVPGTGLNYHITHPKVHGTLEKAVLELVHMTDIGISVLDLERVRQNRDRRTYLNIVSQTPRPEGEATRDSDVYPRVRMLEEYPRRRLKLFLSDGFIELQAIECERLSQIELGETPMGTKVRWTSV